MRHDLLDKRKEFQSMKVASTSDSSQESAEAILDAVKAMKPVQVMIWWQTCEGQVGTCSSGCPDRTKRVGALVSAAIDEWNA